jgi:hypothetical protein
MTDQILFGAKNSYWQSNAAQCRPTQRAADGGESARFTGFFLASSFFWSQTFVCTRPLSAANASRWLASLHKEGKEIQLWKPVFLKEEAREN